MVEKESFSTTSFLCPLLLQTLMMLHVTLRAYVALREMRYYVSRLFVKKVDFRTVTMATVLSYVLQVRSNNEEFRDTFPTLTTLPGYFLNLGYDVRGMGKVFHKDAPETRTGLSWSSFSGTSSLQSTSKAMINATRRNPGTMAKR